MAKLPKGYIELDYIQSNGTEYIDTGFKPNQNTRVTLDGQYLGGSTESYIYVMSAMDTVFAKRYSVMITKSTGICSSEMSNNTSVNFPKTILQTDRLKIDKDKNVCTINGETVTNNANAFQSPVSLCIFAMSQSSGVSRILKHKLYNCAIYDNGTLVRDFVPCKNPAGAIGLYDTVNGTFYGNAGTGAFTAGPTVLLPPTTPTGIGQGLTVRLTWTAVDTAESYNVYRDGQLIGNTEELAYTDTTVSDMETYVYGISAVNAAGESEPAEITIYTKIGYFIYKPIIESVNFQ